MADKIRLFYLSYLTDKINLILSYLEPHPKPGGKYGSMADKIRLFYAYLILSGTLRRQVLITG